MFYESLKSGFRSGYLQVSAVLNRAFNTLLSVVLILLCAPLFLAIALLVVICDGPPILYRGTRLGLHKKPFTIYKFRTLVREAEKIIGPQLLSSSHKLVTPVGQYLRDSRLDELPQLFNILLQDMDFIGPRPERAEIYEHICRHIPGYDKRFDLKPGLIGYSQLFTPHSTPKRIRTLIDNRLAKRKQVLMWDAYVIGITGLVVLRNTFEQIGKWLRRLVMVRILRRYSEKRELERVEHHHSSVLYGPAGCKFSLNGNPAPAVARLVDINERAFLIRSNRPIAAPFPERFALCIETPGRGGQTKTKRAHCAGRLYKETRRGENEYEYVIEYSPESPLNFYMMHQYFLRKSVA